MIMMKMISNENEDESIVSLSALQKGGVLDNLRIK
jgi:hypothetical protein